MEKTRPVLAVVNVEAIDRRRPQSTGRIEGQPHNPIFADRLWIRRIVAMNEKRFLLAAEAIHAAGKRGDPEIARAIFENRLGQIIAQTGRLRGSAMVGNERAGRGIEQLKSSTGGDPKTILPIDQAQSPFISTRSVWILICPVRHSPSKTLVPARYTPCRQTTFSEPMAHTPPFGKRCYGKGVSIMPKRILSTAIASCSFHHAVTVIGVYARM